MSLNFFPGRPNDLPQTTCQALWGGHTIFAYCSGNNLIILSNKFTRLQTIYIASDCHAVDINEQNGFIAVAFSDQVAVYKPIHQVMKNPKWAQCCQIHHDTSIVNCIKWSTIDEIIIGSDYLSFWKIHDQYGVYKPVLQWNERQVKPVYMCSISQDSQFMVSVGKFDKTVKFWKRNVISGEQVIFHPTLLPHPGFMTNLKWKKLEQASHSEDTTNGLTETFYSLCSDGKLRIWSCHDLAPKRAVQQWGDLKMSKNQKFCIIIDSSTVAKALPDNYKLPHDLKEVPDIVILATPEGECDVYALSNLSQNPPKLMDKKKLFNKFVDKPLFVGNPSFLYFTEILPYNDASFKVSLVIHDLKGKVRQFTVDIHKLLESGNEMIDEVNHIFTGHNKSIQRLIRSSDGEALLTVSRFSENCIWRLMTLKSGTYLWLKNIINTEAPIKQAVVHEKGGLVIVLLENSKLQAWCCPNDKKDMEDEKAYIISEFQLDESFKIEDYLLMLNTPELKHRHDRHYVAFISKHGKVRSFEVSNEHGISEMKSNKLGVSAENIHLISTIDPVHTTFNGNRPLISVISANGLVTSYKATITQSEKNIEWHLENEITTGLKDASKISGSSTGKICVVDSTEKKITFWDAKRGVLEYEESFEEVVKDIDWTSTEFGQSIVSIGFSNYVLLYTQLRYDYTNRTPSYLPIEKVDITEHTAHNIGDSIWMRDGTFVVASGNQLYVKDKTLDLSDEFVHRSIGSRTILSNDILHLNSVLNGPIPLYHPQFLIQALYCQKLNLVQEILLRLFLSLRKINFESEDIKNLPSDLDLNSSKLFIELDQYYPTTVFPDPYPVFNKTVASEINELLVKMALPYLTRHQQVTLMSVVEAVLFMIDNRKTMDYNGLLFLLSVKLFHSHRDTQHELSLRDISWSLHSDNKEILLSTFDSNILSWSSAKMYKISYWVKVDDLKRKFEQIAKHEFNSADVRDPSKCAIFYLALRKKQVLMSIWKMSIGHPEHQKMIKFLSNNFDQPRWRTSALKNAFALMSKHRYMDAACFFLLADSLLDCVNVLSKQVKDNGLAIGVCRVYEGDNGPILAKFLSNEFLKNAIINDDRWMASFIYWKLRKQHLAIQALITAPLNLDSNETLVSKDECVNKSFLIEDPALLIMYGHLRQKNIRYFMGAVEIENKTESDQLLKVSDIYNRMGCDYLSVSLLKNWKFIHPRVEVEPTSPQSPSSNKLSAFPAIDTLESEPTTTNRFKMSLFDKFGGDYSDRSKSSVNHNETRPPLKSMLDDFAEEIPSNTGTVQSLNTSLKSASNSQDVQAQNSPNNLGTKNALDDYAFSGSKTVPNEHEHRSQAPTKKNLDSSTSFENQKPRSLLDDYEAVTNVEPNSAMNGFKDLPSKVSSGQWPSMTGQQSLATEMQEKSAKSDKGTNETTTSKPKNLLDDFM